MKAIDIMRYYYVLNSPMCFENLGNKLVAIWFICKNLPVVYTLKKIIEILKNTT